MVAVFQPVRRVSFWKVNQLFCNSLKCNYRMSRFQEKNIINTALKQSITVSKTIKVFFILKSGNQSRRL